MLEFCKFPAKRIIQIVYFMSTFFTASMGLKAIKGEAKASIEVASVIGHRSSGQQTEDITATGIIADIYLLVKHNS